MNMDNCIPAERNVIRAFTRLLGSGKGLTRETTFSQGVNEVQLTRKGVRQYGRRRRSSTLLYRYNYYVVQ